VTFNLDSFVFAIFGHMSLTTYTHWQAMYVKVILSLLLINNVLIRVMLRWRCCNGILHSKRDKSARDVNVKMAVDTAKST